MKTLGELKTVKNMYPSEHKIEVGAYSERMYFIDTPAFVSDHAQSKIEGLLVRNQGVGIIAGCFDEKLSIRMISGFAGRLLDYNSAEDVIKYTDGSLLNIAMADKDFIRNKLANSSEEVCGCSFKAKNGTFIPVRVSHDIGTGPKGEKMWYISIRRLGEIQFDALTGAFTRHGFSDYIKKMKSGGTDISEYAILYINLKGFKAINDLYGSAFGDSLLMEVYNYLNCSELKPTACSRKESDKFLLLVDRANINLENLNNFLKIPYSCKDKQGFIDAVCGIYYIDDSEIEVGTMIECAVLAESRIENMFISPYAVFTPSMRFDYLSRIRALSYFEEALSNNEFKVYYQPVVDSHTGKVTSAEALIRWETADGIIAPSNFIPALEENGCISKLDEYVFNQTVNYLHRREQSNLPLVPISVNVSRMDFFDRDRTLRVCELLQKDSIARHYTHFEITETSYRSIKELQAEFIEKINSYGGKVYIDDFGVANSSIDMLSQYDFAVLKLDMQFSREMTKSRKVRTLMKTTIHMTHELGMKVIAEGVETDEQLSLLREMHCDYIQGYYFSKPLDEQSFTKYLNEHI